MYRNAEHLLIHVECFPHHLVQREMLLVAPAACGTQADTQLGVAQHAPESLAELLHATLWNQKPGVPIVHRF